MQQSEVYWDPYDPELVADPYPVFKRLREEAPLYYNEKYDFYAVSRFEDVMKGLLDRDTFISGRGGIIEFIKSGVIPPKGVFIFEDPPLHTIHRGLLTRVFTPKRMNDLEPAIRRYCAQALDPIVGSGKFDFVRDLGAQMPMQVIGMLLGIPEADREGVRERADAALRTEVGKPQEYNADHNFAGEGFGEYIEWRLKHPADDLMTQLVQTEFEDETGTTRRLSIEELMIFINILSSNAYISPTSTVRGWQTLPTYTDGTKPARTLRRYNIGAPEVAHG